MNDCFHFSHPLRHQMRASIHWIMLLLGILLLSAPAAAQGFQPYRGAGTGPRGLEIIPFAGYQFGGKMSAVALDGRSVEVSFQDGLELGVSIDTPPAFGGGRMQLMWSMQDSKLNFKNDFTGERGTFFDMKIHYFMIGAVYEATQGGNAVPFGMINFGVTLFHPRERGLSDAWRFSFGFGGGVKTYINERFGFRFQGRMLVPIQWGSGALWCGGENGCTVAVGGSNVIIQGEFSVGMMLVL